MAAKYGKVGCSRAIRGLLAICFSDALYPMKLSSCVICLCHMHFENKKHCFGLLGHLRSWDTQYNSIKSN